MSNEQQEYNSSRRKVLSSGVATLGLSTLARIVNAQPESGAASGDNKTKLVERDITYRSGDTEIRAFQTEPAATPKAAIVIIHEIFGLNPHIRDVARRFARQGYVCLAPDLYSREGAPNLDVSKRDALMAFIASIPDRRVVGDLQAGIEYLNGRGVVKIGSIGFCMGGLYSYLLACKSEKLNAAVDFYGRIVYAETTANKPESPVDLAPQLKCPLLCNFGEQDGSIPQTDVQKLRERLKQSTQSWKINVYPGAGHAFFNDTRPSYQGAAATDAGSETLAFLKKYLSVEID